MAFKRSAVRSRLSPPQEAKAENRGISFEIHGFFLPSVCLKLGAKRHFRLLVMFSGGERMRATGN